MITTQTLDPRIAEQFEARTGFPLEPALVMLCLVGSDSHGTKLEKGPDDIDDVDFMGVYVPPPSYTIGIRSDSKHAETVNFQYEELDCVFYSLRHFVQLLLKSNPNVLGTLWLLPEHYVVATPEWEALMAQRGAFSSQASYQSFSGYAYGQAKKMESFDRATQEEWKLALGVIERAGYTREQIVSGEHREMPDYKAVSHWFWYDGEIPDRIAREETARRLWPGIPSGSPDWVDYGRPVLDGAIKSVIRIHARHHKGYMGEKRRDLVTRHGYDCYDEAETEFLTESGWRRFDDVGPDARMATVDPVSGSLVYQRSVSRTDRLYTGYMYRIHPAGSEAVVTENHNLLLSPVHRSPKNGFSVTYDQARADWSLRSVRSALAGRRSFFHTRIAPEPRWPDYAGVNDDYLRLSGLYVSEGTTAFRGESVKAARITQTAGGKEEVFAEMDSMAAFRRYDYAKESVWIASGDAARRLHGDFGHGSREKRLPAWCFRLSARQADVFWHSLVLGDGSFAPKLDYYHTANERLAGDIQAMLLSAGHHAVVGGPYSSVSAYTGEPIEMFQVRRSTVKTTRVRTLTMRRILRHGQEPETGKRGYPVRETFVRDRRIVCFEVPNGTLITRCNGRPAIHGNSKNAAHLVRLLRMCTEFLGGDAGGGPGTAGEFRVLRTWDAEEIKDIKRGLWKLEDVKAEAARLETVAEAALATCGLPEKPDRQVADDLLIRLTRWRYGWAGPATAG